MSAHLPKDCIKFLKELKKNNDRDWFNTNKKRYINSVKEPFEEFVQDLIARMQKVDPEVMITPKEAIFRIYRDVRFSKDKSPYKTQVSAMISRGGRKNHTTPGVYIQIGADDARIYSGVYTPDKTQLGKIRYAIASDPKKIDKLRNLKAFKEKFGGEILGDKNKVLPKELKEAAAVQPLIFNKGFYYFAKFKPMEATEPDFAKKIIDHYKAAKPMNEYLYTLMNS